MNEQLYYVYIMTNMRVGKFYIGMTSDLPKRVCEHKNNVGCGCVDLTPDQVRGNKVGCLIFWCLHRIANLYEARCGERLQIWLL